jgi:hypothetical protein
LVSQNSYFVVMPHTPLAVWAAAGLAEGLSAATGGLVREEGEVEEVWDELAAGSAAVAVQANAEAEASEVIRI